MDDLDLDEPTAGPSTSKAGANANTGPYMYLSEISQMMFVFGHVVDPPEAVLQIVENIVKHQIIGMLVEAKNMSLLRQSRHLSPEDFLFLVRYDKAKVNRLRTYLSWKEVRKNAKDDTGAAPGEMDLNAVEDAEANKMQPGVSRRPKPKVPWELTSLYADYIVPGAGANRRLSGAGGAGGGTEAESGIAKVQPPPVDEDVDEEDQEAVEESLARLREADQATLKMTREEYERYSECRQASFTFKKSKRFREFIASSNYLDLKPNDDIIDILGFLGFELVREITLKAKAIWKQEQIAEQRRAQEAEARSLEKKRQRTGAAQLNAAGSASASSKDAEQGVASGSGTAMEKATSMEKTLSKGSSSDRSLDDRASSNSGQTRSINKSREVERQESTSPKKKKKRKLSLSPSEKDAEGVDHAGEGEEAGNSAAPAVDEQDDEYGLRTLYPSHDSSTREDAEPAVYCSLFSMGPGAAAAAASVEDATEDKRTQETDKKVPTQKEGAEDIVMLDATSTDKAKEGGEGKIVEAESSSDPKPAEADPADDAAVASAKRPAEAAEISTDEAKAVIGDAAASAPANGDAVGTQEDQAAAAASASSSTSASASASSAAAAAEVEVQEEREEREEEETPLLLPHHVQESFARMMRFKSRPALTSGSHAVSSGWGGGVRGRKIGVA